jgi:MraZ protein
VAQSGEKWGINMLSGEYRHSIDLKGRIIIPSKIRDEMGSKIVITRGLDGCLFGYNEKTWITIMEKLNTLPYTKRDVRNFTRFMTSGAITLEFDKQGRVNIPNYLNEYANLLKDVVIVGVINRIEIWSKDKWEEFMNNNVESLSDISENLFDSNFEL